MHKCTILVYDGSDEINPAGEIFVLRRLLTLPLRTQLLIMAFLLCLPSFGLIMHIGFTQRAESLRKGYKETRRLAKIIAREQYNLTGDIEQLLMALEQIPEIRNHDVVATNEILSNIRKKSPFFANIIITDRDGNVRASALPLSQSFSIKEWLSFQQTAKTKRFSSGNYVLGKVSQKATVGFCYPIISSKGDLDGVISANLNFSELNDLIQGTGLPAGASFSILDRDGVIVDRSLDPEKYVGSKFRDDVFQRIKSGPEKDTFISDYASGGKWIISYHKMKLRGEQDPYLYVCAASPLAGVMGNANQAMLLNIIILSSIFLIVAVSVIILGNVLFVKRISALKDAAQQVADGNLQTRADDSDEKSEIGQLAQVFNKMAAKLSARRKELVEREHELSELNKNLTKRVTEEADRRLEQERLLARHARLVAMGEMIGAIAHQWRQPLATLGATIQSIRMAWERNCLDDAFLIKAEEDAGKQLVYMSDTIEDFRNFFRPEKTSECFDVREKIAEVMILVSPQFGHSGILLQVIDNSLEGPFYIKGYQNEFKQALLNLISNAFDAIIEKALSQKEPCDGDTETGTVKIFINRIDNQVAIQVRDNGIGIPPEHNDKLFDPYFTTKSGDKGTGIGLFMTKLIIEESMGGRLDFTSGPGGTAFVMELAACGELEEKCDE